MKVFGTALWRRIRPLLPAVLVGLVVAVGLWFWWPYQPRRTLNLAGPCLRLILSPDGRHLATLSDIDHDFNVRLQVFDVSTGETLPTPAEEMPTATRATLAFSPDGQTAAAAFPDHVVIWDIRTGIEQQKLTCLSGEADLLFTRNGTLVSTQVDDIGCRAIDHRTGKELARAQMLVLDTTIDKDFIWGVAGSGEKTIHICHWASDQWHKQLPNPAAKPYRPYRLAVSHDGQTVVAAAMIDTPWRVPTTLPTHEIHVWDGAWQRRIDVPFIWPNMAVSPDGRFLAAWGTCPAALRTTWWDDVRGWLGVRRAGSGRTDLKVFDLNSNRELTTIPDVTCADFSPDGSTLAVDQENQVHLYDVPLRKPLIKIAGVSFAAILLTFLPKGFAHLRRRKPPRNPVGAT